MVQMRFTQEAKKFERNNEIPLDEYSNNIVGGSGIIRFNENNDDKKNDKKGKGKAKVG